MAALNVRDVHEAKKQQNLRYLHNSAMAMAGLIAGLFFVWMSFTSDMGGFPQAMAFVFGVSIAVAAVTSGYLKR